MKYDLIVIGGGSAGHSAATTAVSLGLSTALVEAPGELGGLCILRGCMPSKTLIETANRMRIIREASRFAINASYPELAPGALRRRLADLIGDFRDYRRKEMKKSGYTLLRGTASFTTANDILLEESGETHSASAFIIATGSRPGAPAIPGLDQTPYWTSDDIVKMPDSPPSIAILGSGAIGMEAAHLFEGFGSRVTVIARGKRILNSFDPDIAEALEAESRERGIQFLTETRISRVNYATGRFSIIFEDQDDELAADAFLVATGRIPNTTGFGFQKIGLAMDRKRILIDTRCSTSLPHIFAAGDCASPVPVVHLAVIQGQVAARNVHTYIRDRHSGMDAEWHPPSAMTGLFTEPQCVSIGLSESEAGEKNINTVTGRIDYNDQGKGMISGSRHGFVKIIADAETGKIIGAKGIGPEVLETSHLLQSAIFSGLTLKEYAAIPHYHPSLAEAWASAAEAALDSLDKPAS